MIPTIAAPNIQIAPPVEVSAVTAPSQEPALGRLPMNIVSPPVTNPKVADNPRGGQNLPKDNAPPAASKAPAGQPFALSGQGELAFESPYSTTFVAQIFGQTFLSEGGGIVDGFLDFEQLAQLDMVKYKPSLAFRPRAEMPQAESAPAPQVAEAPAPPAAEQAAPVETRSIGDVQSWMQSVLGQGVSMDLRDMPVVSSDAPPQPQTPASDTAEAAPRAAENSGSPSIFTGGVDAYGATQSRNQVVLMVEARETVGGREVSLIS